MNENFYRFSDPKISKNNFELEEMLEILNTILLSNEKQSTIVSLNFVTVQ